MKEVGYVKVNKKPSKKEDILKATENKQVQDKNNGKQTPKKV